jgi:hypothetical protein
VAERGWAARRAELTAALPPWVVARILVVVGYLIVAAAADEFAPHRHIVKLDQHLLAWDADWYDAIADQGYGRLPNEAVRFFPLFPMLGRVLGWAFAGNQGLALIVIANLAALAGGMLFYRLALEETGDQRLATRAAWFFALFPGAFVLVWGYAEGLMLVALIGAFLALRRHAWWVVAGLGVAAGLARPLGLFLVLPVAWEATRDWRDTTGRERLARLAAVAGAPVGVLSYLAYTAARGSGFFDPLTEQSPYRGAVTDPVSRLAHAVGDMVTPDRLGDAVHPPMALLMVFLTIVVIRKLPVRYALFTVPVVLVSLSAESFNSLERYGLNAFPLILALALVTDRQELNRAAIALGAAGIVALTAFSWIGNYVP